MKYQFFIVLIKLTNLIPNKLYVNFHIEAIPTQKSLVAVFIGFEFTYNLHEYTHL